MRASAIFHRRVIVGEQLRSRGLAQELDKSGNSLQSRPGEVLRSPRQPGDLLKADRAATWQRSLGSFGPQSDPQRKRLRSVSS